MNPDEIRSAFNVQHPRNCDSQWQRLNLSTGPVLARRNVAHYSSPVYVVVVNEGVAKHWLVTIMCQLRFNGTTSVSPSVDRVWRKMIGYTEAEYLEAKAKGDTDRTRLYEQGPRVAA